MIDSDANRKISVQAKTQAESTLGGGLERLLNDMQSYGDTVGKGALTFAIQHIPFVGPSLAKGFDLAASKGISAIYKKLLKEAKTPEQRISYALFSLEKSLASTLRQAFNTVATYDASVGEDRSDCKDCQAAFKAAYEDHLALACTKEIEDGCKILKTLARDLEVSTRRLKHSAETRVKDHDHRYDNFRENHPDKRCMGLQACYWHMGQSVFGSITNDML
jgi:hypothetical protein